MMASTTFIINYHSNFAALMAHYAMLPGLHFETVKAAREFSEREAYKVMHNLHQECPGVLFDRSGTGILEYNGKFWALSGPRISYMRDKTMDDRYFLLTLFAIAKELRNKGNLPPMVETRLAVGLPPEHYGVLRAKFAEYFKHGAVKFAFNGAPCCVVFRHVLVFPQAFAAVVSQVQALKEAPRTFIIDIGGYTTDVLLLRNARPDLQFCRSLEMGVITMANDIVGKVSALRYIKIEDDHIADVLQGRPTILPQEVRDTIFYTVQGHANSILDKLRELQVDLRANPAIFIGGGAILYQSFIENAPLVVQAEFLSNTKANARGYE